MSSHMCFLKCDDPDYTIMEKHKKSDKAPNLSIQIQMTI